MEIAPLRCLCIFHFCRFSISPTLLYRRFSICHCTVQIELRFATLSVESNRSISGLAARNFVGSITVGRPKRPSWFVFEEMLVVRRGPQIATLFHDLTAIYCQFKHPGDFRGWMCSVIGLCSLILYFYHDTLFLVFLSNPTDLDLAFRCVFAS